MSDGFAFVTTAFRVLLSLHFQTNKSKKGFTTTNHCDDNEISFLISRFRKNPGIVPCVLEWFGVPRRKRGVRRRRPFFVTGAGATHSCKKPCKAALDDTIPYNQAVENRIGFCSEARQTRKVFWMEAFPLMQMDSRVFLLEFSTGIASAAGVE